MNKFKNLNSTLGQLLKKYDLDHLYALQQIKSKWQQMDKTIAAHSEPIEYQVKKKKLIIKITNHAWKKEFISNKEQLLLKIKTYFKTIEITNIEFI